MIVDGHDALSTKYPVYGKIHFMSLNVTSRLTHGNDECQSTKTRKSLDALSCRLRTV